MLAYQRSCIAAGGIFFNVSPELHLSFVSVDGTKKFYLALFVKPNPLLIAICSWLFQPSAPLAAIHLLVADFLYQRKKYLYYSVLKLFTGFAMAAFTTCKPIVAVAIIIAANADNTKTHQLIFIL